MLTYRHHSPLGITPQRPPGVHPPQNGCTLETESIAHADRHPSHVGVIVHMQQGTSMKISTTCAHALSLNGGHPTAFNTVRTSTHMLGFPLGTNEFARSPTLESAITGCTCNTRNCSLRYRPVPFFFFWHPHFRQGGCTTCLPFNIAKEKLHH